VSWIYIIGVIIFAIVSNVNKAQKGNGKQKNAPRGAMPTFGGEGKDVFSKMRGYMQPEARKPEVQKSGFPVPGKSYSQTDERTPSAYETADYEASPAFSESPLSPTPDYETGEGLSLERPGEERLETRMKDMDRDLDRLYSAFNKISTVDDNHLISNSSDGRSMQTKGNSTTVTSKQLQNGLIWAEILSSPRSKRPFNSRREG